MRAATAGRAGVLLVFLSACAEADDPIAPELPAAFSTIIGADRIVNTLDDFVDGTGCTAEHCSLREAILGATSGQTIGFGVSGIIQMAAPVPFFVDEAISIVGPGSASLTIAASGAPNSGHFRVLPGMEAAITGLRLTGATSGAVVNQGTLTLDDLIIEQNQAEFGGGIVNGGTLTIRNSIVRANVATRGGGGIFSYGTMTADHVEIADNVLAYVGSGLPAGGGLVNAGTMLLRGSRVTSNRVIAPNGQGGGLHNSVAGANGVVENTLFANNNASAGGAINNTATLLVRGSTLRSNRATGIFAHGGAIATREGTLEIENSLLQGNSAVATGPGAVHATGSAIFNADGMLTLRHVNIYLNTIDTPAGLAAAVTSLGPLQMLNSIVAGNAGNGDHFDVVVSIDGVHDVRGNVLGSVAPWMTGTDAANLLGITVPSGDWESSFGFAAQPEVDGIFRYRVLPGSVVIDRGVSDGCTAMDVTGTARPQGAACDAGAVESIPDLLGPIATLLNAPIDPVAAGSSIRVSARIDDSSAGASAIGAAAVTLDGFATSTHLGAVDGAIDETEEVVEGILGTPAEAGLYELCVRGSDRAGNTGDAACTVLVVYDPAAGFVTGGGWIESPAGAYAADPTLTGKGTFGFVARYRRGAHVPDGQARFVFHAAGLRFESTAYSWLVVAGARSQFKGTGAIDGVDGTFDFMLTAVDADPDRLRLRIIDRTTDTILYDNGSDQPIGGGSIVVHQQ